MKIIFNLILGLVVFGSLSACSSPEEKAATHLASAEAFMEKDDPDKARIEYRSALQFDQNLAGAWYGLARIHEQRGEWNKAYNILARIRDSNPKYMNGRILLANILLAAGRIDEALEDARDVVELEPDDPRSHAVMATVQFRLGNLQLDPQSEDAILVKARILISEDKYADALELLDRMLVTSPKNASYYVMKIGIHQKLGDQSAVLQTYTDLAKQFPENDGFTQALVRHLILAGNLDHAEQLLRRSVTENPESIEYKLRLVRFLNRHRSTREAISLLNTYIEQEGSENRFRFALAEFYLRDNQTGQAIAIYRGIIQDDGLRPDGLEARNVLARIHLLAGQLAESKVLIDEVLAHDKNNLRALLVLARFNLAEGRQDDAIVNLRTVLREDSTSVEALTLLGQAQAEQGASNLAIESLSSAFEMSPASADIAVQLATLLVQTGQSERADEILGKSIEAGNESIETLRMLAQVKLNLGKWEQAEQVAQLLRSFEGEEALAQHMLGLAYHGRDLMDESILAFTRAHELNPQLADPMVALVKSHVENGQFEKARAFLLSVVGENPENSVAYHLLGQLSLRDKDTRAAIGYFEKVIEAAPESELGYLSLGTLYLRQHRIPKAEAVFAGGKEAVPESLDLSINLALVVESQGKIDRAIELYESILMENPDVIIAKNNLASLLSDYRDDVASHERARELAADLRDSKIPLFRDTYAWTSVKLELYLEEAIVILKGILRDEENVGLYHYHLGEAYRKNGNKFDARKHLRRAIELEGDESPIAAEAQKSLGLVSQ